MADSYPLDLDLGQIHCISLYPPESSASRRCKVQRTKDKGQYTLTQSPLQRGRVPHPGRDTRPPREGKTVAVQPATTCTEPRHASGSGCPAPPRERRQNNCRPASNYMHRAKTRVWLRLRPLLKVDLVRGALAVGVTLPLLKVWRPTRVLHLLLDMQCRRCWDAACWPALAVAPAQQLSCRCRRCCQGRVAVSSSPSDAASRATVLRRPLWWERWAHAGHGPGWGSRLGASLRRSSTPARPRTVVRYMYMYIYLCICHCICIVSRRGAGYNVSQRIHRHPPLYLPSRPIAANKQHTIYEGEQRLCNSY